LKQPHHQQNQVAQPGITVSGYALHQLRVQATIQLRDGR
jgi:hypothetical protein